MLFGHVAAVMFKLTEKRRKARLKGGAAADESKRGGDHRVEDKPGKR